MSGEKGGQGSKKRAPEHIADEQTIKTHKLLKMIPFTMELKHQITRNKAKEKVYINKSL